MTKTAQRLIKILDENARYSNAELASMLSVSVDEVKECIAQLEKDKIICGYKALVDWEKLSSAHVNALIELRVTPQRDAGFEEIARTIMMMDEVESVSLMSGGYDFSVSVQGKSFKDIAMFVAKRLATMDNVVSTATHFVLRRYKQLGVPLVGSFEDERGPLSL